MVNTLKSKVKGQVWPEVTKVTGQTRDRAIVERTTRVEAERGGVWRKGRSEGQ